eukprot:Skav206770  [mRNA]  locus=scaffold167:518352:522925:+ [translate_table: standard]
MRVKEKVVLTTTIREPAEAVSKKEDGTKKKVRPLPQPVEAGRKARQAPKTKKAPEPTKPAEAASPAAAVSPAAAGSEERQGPLEPQITADLSEDERVFTSNLHRIDVKVAENLKEWTEMVKQVFKENATFGDLGRHLWSLASSLPTALGNFVRTYCSTAQPSTSAEGSDGSKHGDLLPINPCLITTDIEGVTTGNLDWVRVIVACIDFHFCVGWARPVCVPMQEVLTEQQKRAVSRLASTVTSNIITADPISTLGECDKLLSSKKFDYAGRPVEYMEDLQCSRILPCWPKVGQAAVQPLENFLSAETREIFDHPERLLLAPEMMPKKALRSKVRATDDEWFRICKEAAARGMMRPVEDSAVPTDRSGHLITNGAGAVSKEKVIDGKVVQCQRFISIMCPVNAVTEPIAGSQDTLPYIGQMTGLLLEESESLVLESEDLQSAFNLFSVPDRWLGYFAYSKKVDQSAFGLPAGKMVRPALGVVPMGWHSAVALVQEAVRDLVFNRSGVPRELSAEKGKPLPDTKEMAVVYLDNFDEIRIIQSLDADFSKEGVEMSEHHRRFNEECDKAGLPRNLGKQLIHAFGGGMQGGHFDGVKGVLKVGPDKLRNYLMLSLALLSKKQWGEFHLRHWTGKTAFLATFRRSLFSGMGRIFDEVEKSRRGPVSACGPVVDEIFVMMTQAVLSQANLKATLSPEISCTDASPSGGGSATATVIKEHALMAPPPVDFDGTCGHCGEDMDPATLSTRYRCPSKCGRICCSILCFSKHRLGCPRDDQPKRVFGERFSGPSFPLTKAMGLFGLHVQPPLDLLHPVDPWDYFEDAGKERLEKYVDEGNLIAEHWAPECKTFSAARGKPVITSSGRWIQGPPALRSREKPWGLPKLKQFEQIKVRQGNAMAKRSLTGVKEGVARGKFESIEHPWNSHLWWTEEAMNLCEVPGMFVTGFSHCCFGGKRTKWTCIVHNIPRLHELMNRETCPGHADLLPYEVHEMDDGSLSFDTAEEAMYPWMMCRAMAQALKEQIDRQFPSPIGDMPFDSETAVMSVLRSSTKGFQCEHKALAAAKKVVEVMRQMKPGEELTHLKQMLRQVSLRGTDIKLMSEAENGAESAMSPYPAFLWKWATKLSFKWRTSQHINELELRQEQQRQTEQAAEKGQRFGADVGLPAGPLLDHIAMELRRQTELYPRVRKELAISQQWYNNWSRQHVPNRAVPITWDIVLGFAGLAMHLKWPRLCLLFVVGFTFFLRTQELLQLTVSDFKVDCKDGTIVLRISSAKTSYGNQQSVAKTDYKLAILVQHLLDQLPDDSDLWQYSTSHFRNVLKSFSKFFDLSYLGLVPYSLRRGGATEMYLRTNNLEAVMIQGRWRDSATARIYLDDARATLVRQTLPLSAKRLIRHFRLPLLAFLNRVASGKLADWG